MNGTAKSSLRANPLYLRLALVAVVVAVPLQRLRGSFPTGRFFHSDIAFLPALFGDVARGGDLSAWGLPEAPYFIPDVPLYLIAWILTPSYSSGQALFALFQIGLLAWLWTKLMHWLSPEPLLASVLGVGLLVAAALGGQVPADYITVSFAHFGTVLLTLGSLVLYLAAKFERQGETVVARERPDARILAGVALLTLACTASDRVYVSWWVVPVLGIEVLLLLKNHVRPAVVRQWLLPSGSWKLSLAYVMGTLGGLVVRSRLVRTSGDYSVGISTEIPVTHRLDLVYSSFIQSELIELWPWYSLLVVVTGLIWLWQWWQRREDPVFVLFTLWFAAAIVSSISAELLIAEGAWRYHQFIYQLPILVAGIWVAQILGRLRLKPAALAIGGSAGLLAWGLFPINMLSLHHYPPEVECLDRVLADSGSRIGIGNYAVSRLVVVNSEFELEVGTRNTFFAPEEDVHSRDWARDSADFVILHPTVFGAMPENTIRSLSEVEPVEMMCGEWKVLDFGPGGLDLTRLDDLNRAVVVPGCWYIEDSRRQPGTDCSLAIRASDLGAETERIVGASAFYPTEPGLYRLSANLTYSEDDEPLGSFKVTLWDGNSGLYLSVLNAPFSDPAILVEVPDDGPELSLEGRIVYNGGGELILDSMTIERLG